jgi:hypothetical protein
MHIIVALLFACASLVLIAIGAVSIWEGLRESLDRSAAEDIIEAIGLLTAAVVALQITQTIIEEEIIRDAHVSGPTRVRRFMSRFLVVVVVALAIESLIATFRAAHEEQLSLLYSAALVFAIGGLLAGWGIFVRMNRYAEELEPEAMREAQIEDRKLR